MIPAPTEPSDSRAETATGVAYDRAGPRGDATILLIHAGVADRRMWDPQWDALTSEYDAIRVDLRGFGDSRTPPSGPLAPLQDVLGVLATEEVERCDLVGASFGAGVSVELALAAPDRVRSLLLVAPGGSLLTEATPDIRDFFQAEREALARDDLVAAVEANLRWWVDSPHRPGGADPAVRERVALMQRQAFEITGPWGDLEQDELDPPATERLDELDVPTLVLLGGADLHSIRLAAESLRASIAGSRLVSWPDLGHLPSMERPQEFLDLLRDWRTDLDRHA